MEPSGQFRAAVIARLQQDFSASIYDAIPENAPLPHAAWLDDSFTDDSSKDVRGWLGNFTFEVFDLDEVGRSRIATLLSELDEILHGLKEGDLAMSTYRLNWISYQSSGTTRTGGDSRFRGVITFVCRLESLEESNT